MWSSECGCRRDKLSIMFFESPYIHSPHPRVIHDSTGRKYHAINVTAQTQSWSMLALNVEILSLKGTGVQVSSVGHEPQNPTRLHNIVDTQFAYHELSKINLVSGAATASVIGRFACSICGCNQRRHTGAKCHSVITVIKRTAVLV
jgi:hypothetical protein